MRKIVLRTIALSIVLAAGIFAAAAQGKQQVTASKTRVVTVFWLRGEDGPGTEKLVEVRRTVAARRSPLEQAVKMLMSEPTESETEPEAWPFIEGVELISARLKNETALIRFKERDDCGCWGVNMKMYFKEAVEKTALAVSGVKKVEICLNGYVDYWRRGTEEDPHVPCSQ